MKAWQCVALSILLIHQSVCLPIVKFFKELPEDACFPPSKRPESTQSRHSDMLLDMKHHIIMDWTPKAACTRMVEMFWREMGITRDDFFTGVHDHRPYFYTKCGSVSEELLNDATFYKFKAVRNPFTRVVSSYFHIMGKGVMHTIFSHQYVKPNKTRDEQSRHPMDDMSFEEMLEFYIEKVKNKKPRRNAATYHFGQQSSIDEVKKFKANEKSLFNYIVHLETFEEDIAVVNKATGRNYSFPIDSRLDAHDVLKSITQDSYQGNKPYHYFIEHGFPKNYGEFYNEKTRKLVQEIFIDDMLVYNYTFPFDRYYR